jgi:FixJ family two-component response regulator
MTSSSPVVLVDDDDASVRDGLRRLIPMAEVFPALRRSCARAGPMRRNV